MFLLVPAYLGSPRQRAIKLLLLLLLFSYFVFVTVSVTCYVDVIHQKVWIFRKLKFRTLFCRENE